MSRTSSYSNKYTIRLAKTDDKSEIRKFLSSAKILQNSYSNLIILGLEILFLIPSIFFFLVLPFWKHRAVLEYNLNFIFSLLVLILILLFIVIWLIIEVVNLNKRINPNNCAVAIHKGKIVGITALCRTCSKTYLAYLFVKQEHRQKGIGTNLLKEIVKTTQSSVYVQTLPLLSSFYLDFGFEKVKYKSPLRSWLNKDGITEQLVLLPQRETLKQKDLEQGSLSKKYTLQKANHRDIPTIYQLLENMAEDTKDSFLPFGFHIAIRISLPYCLLLMFLTIETLALGISSAIVYDLLQFTIIIITTIIFLAGIFSVHKISLKIIKKHLPQFWLIKDRDKIIGYGRLSRKEKYSILYHIYVLAYYDIEPIEQLIEHFSKLETQPIYVACPKKIAELYYKYGFTRIKIQKLPKELQLGAKVSLKCMGVNLVLLP